VSNLEAAAAILQRWSDDGMWDLEPYATQLSVALGTFKTSAIRSYLAAYRNGNMPYSADTLARQLTLWLDNQ
jgi:hypothetical protein